MATVADMGGRRVRRACSGDMGAASLEYAGVLSVVGLVVAALILGATPIGGALKSQICAALDAVCGNAAAQDRFDKLAKCVVRRDDRTLAYGGNVRFVNLDRKDGDRFAVNSDGSASITLNQSAAGGLGITGKSPRKANGEDSPFSVDARLQGVGDVGYVYNVSQSWGGEEMARSILDDKAGTLDRYGNLVLGPWVTSAEEGLDRAADGIGNGWRWVMDKSGIDHESAEEQAARERVESLSQADAIAVSLGLQGQASVSGDAGLVKGSASGTATAKGTVQVSLNSDGEDAAGNNFTGTVDLKGTLEGVVGWPGTGPPGQAPTADIPPFLSAALVGGALWSYKVDYDGDGNPTKLTMTTEQSGQFQGGLKPPKASLPGGGGLSVNGKANASVGTASVEEIVLDLTAPENRAAFDDMFATYGVGVDGHQAQVSAMKLFEFDTLMARAEALSDRLVDDALVMRYQYDLSGTNVGAGGQQRQDGLDFAVAGVNWENSSLTRELTSATAYDMAQGGLEFEIVNCG